MTTMNRRPILLGQPEVISLIPRRIQRILDNEGLYIGSNPADCSDGEAPLVSMEGKIYSMQLGKELDPTAVNDGLRIDGPFRSGDGTLHAFQEEVGEWAAATFKQQTIASKIAHMRRELIELEKAPNDAGEMADLLILLCGIAALAEVDLMEAARIKMEVNRARTWSEPDAEGVCSHV